MSEVILIWLYMYCWNYSNDNVNSLINIINYCVFLIMVKQTVGILHSEIITMSIQTQKVSTMTISEDPPALEDATGEGMIMLQK